MLLHDSLDQNVARCNPAGTEFHQTVLDVPGSVGAVLVKHTPGNCVNGVNIAGVTTVARATAALGPI